MWSGVVLYNMYTQLSRCFFLKKTPQDVLWIVNVQHRKQKNLIPNVDYNIC